MVSRKPVSARLAFIIAISLVALFVRIHTASADPIGPLKSCEETDGEMGGRKNFGLGGTVTYEVWGKPLQTEQDSCDGEVLTEWFCETIFNDQDQKKTFLDKVTQFCPDLQLLCISNA